MSSLLRNIIMLMPKAVAHTYATWNPSDKGSNVTLSNGNLTASISAYTNSGVRATIAKTTGKWYWELAFSSINTLSVPVFGSRNSADALPSAGDASQTSVSGTTSAAVSGQGWSGNYLPNTAAGDVWGIALDADAKTVSYYKNNTFVRTNSITDGATSFTAFLGDSNSPGGFALNANFGATAFAYTPPSGFNSGLYST